MLIDSSQEEKNIIGEVGVLVMAMIEKTNNAAPATTTTTTSDSKYTEDWVPVKNIMNGMIQLDNGYYVTGVKVAPKNIFILDAGERENVLFNLQNFYNMIDYEFWLVVADRPVDINLYLSQLQLLYQRSPNGAIRKLIMQDINKANAFVGQEYNIVDTEYFILFKEKDGQMLQKKLRNMINSLATAGLVASQTSNDDLRMIIDNFFNGGRKYESGGVMPV